MATIRGGEKLERRLQELAEKVADPATLRVGFLQKSKYPDGTSVAMVAAIQNFGAPSRGIPPRPFFSNVVAKGRRTWGQTLTKLLENNDFSAKKTLEQMGEHIRGEIQDEINNGSFTPLAPSTVRRKGFDKPLIDTADMLRAVDYEVT